MTSGLLVSTETMASERATSASITGSDPVQFLLDADRRRTGPRRLAADVDDGRPLLAHAQARINGGCAGEMPAAVGKRVGRDVQHAHDGRYGEVESPVAAAKFHVVRRQRRLAP